MRRRVSLIVFGRRELLAWGAAAGAAGALGLGCKGPVHAVQPQSFFSDDERRALGALANHVFPPDASGPGAADLGAVDYIETLLTAFDGGGTPTIYAGGPYSGRTPFGNGAGGASTNYPNDDFATWLPLDRYHDAAWRLRLFGSNGVSGGGPNDAIVGPTVGLRDQVKNAIAAAVQAAPGPLDTLDPDSLTSVFLAIDPSLQSLLVSLVSEAVFAPPEYGGNVKVGGWTLAHFEGDSQPLGYSIYDDAAGAYRERADAPVSTPNPGADPEPMDADTAQLISTIVLAINGKVFK